MSVGIDITYTEDPALRVKAHGWHTEWVEVGNDLAATARANTRQPSLILVRTHRGYGASN